MEKKSGLLHGNWNRA